MAREPDAGRTGEHLCCIEIDLREAAYDFELLGNQLAADECTALAAEVLLLLNYLPADC